MKKGWNQLQDALQALRLPDWDALPDFGLYKDQTVAFVQRCVSALEANGIEPLTPSMINNYVKAGLVDRPSGKKYSRAALAQLLMICELKQTVSLSTMKKLLHPAAGGSNQNTQEIYTDFRAHQDTLLANLSKAVELDALGCALEGASYQLLCRMLANQPSGS